jgi:hypothetical protein
MQQSVAASLLAMRKDQRAWGVGRPLSERQGGSSNNSFEPKWPILDSADGDTSATLGAMTTKTIPTYVEDEKRKRGDAELRMAEEAAHIQPRHHGRHRTAKQLKLELPSPVGAAAKITTARKKPRAAQKTATKVRKMALLPRLRSQAGRGRRQCNVSISRGGGPT